ncbi:MAG: Ig-like domain-containing protein [Prevotellaceae bacterium]|nr:Ig-like domain-containing protein [Prevotellaceae bacterium]
MKSFKTLAMVCIALTGCFMASCSDDNGETADVIKKFVLSQSAITLSPEGTETLECTFFPQNIADQEVTWSSSDESVATVSGGVVTALTPGVAVVTATPDAAPSLACRCTVTVAMNTMEVSGTVEGVWEAYTTVTVKGQLEVPQGSSLTIEEGVEVLFNSADAQGTGIEFTVNGNIYCMGTEEAPVVFSIPSAERTFANVLDKKNLWGGFMLNNQADDAEALFSHCDIEYVGSPMTETSPSVLAGIYTAGEDYGVQITTGPSFKGSLVVEYCTIANGFADGIYMQGGKGVITHNVFACNGATGGEAVNVKAGTTTTVAYNVMYSPNTNGLKLSSSGQDDTAGRYQSKCVAYNNTIVNAGWRRDGVKGGCVYVEKNVLANVFNNLMVNCKFRAMAPKWGNPGVKNGCDDKSVIDYNCYLSGSVVSDFKQDEEEGAVQTPCDGYNSSNENYADAVDAHSLIAQAADDIDIAFVNFPYDSVLLSDTSYDSSWDFRVVSMIEGATGDASLARLGDMDYVDSGLTVGGKVYSADAPGVFFGAYAK